MTEENKLTGSEGESDEHKNEELSNIAYKTDKHRRSKKEMQSSLKDITQIVYLCQALSFMFGITAVVGVIINYLKRDEAKGTWLESHFIWQIRTFWFGLLFGVIGWIFTIILIGFLVLAVDLMWVIYRVVKGWLLLCDNKPIENSMALI